jgi:hypothetical protein
LGEADEWGQLPNQDSPVKRAENGGYMFKAWRRATLVAFAGGAALAAQLIAIAPAQAAGPAVTIAASSKLNVVTHDVFVVYGAGAYGSATIHGTISGASSGDVATLFAQAFPFKKGPVKVGSVTLKAAKASYSFKVTPTLFTKYAVRVFAKTSAKPVASSRVQSVFVSSRGSFGQSHSCSSSGACHQTITVSVFVPGSALRFELAKHVYPYFGLSLNPTKVPPEPAWVYLNQGHPSVKSRRINAGEYQVTVNFTFNVGHDDASWVPTECQRDAVLKDGIGLPGSHGCGASRLSTSQYYVG